VIRNILFDLGGVLYEIAPARTRAALERLGRGPACRAILSRFERCYYSYELGLAKPDPLIFERVLGELSFSSRETLVVDDVFENLAAAQMFGTQVLWASSPAWPQQLLARLRSDED